MKALIIWGWILFASAVVLHLVGFFSGIYTELGLYGKTTTAMLLTGFTIVCLLLSITVWAVFRALNEHK